MTALSVFPLWLNVATRHVATGHDSIELVARKQILLPTSMCALAGTSDGNFVFAVDPWGPRGLFAIPLKTQSKDIQGIEVGGEKIWGAVDHRPSGCYVAQNKLFAFGGTSDQRVVFVFDASPPFTFLRGLRLERVRTHTGPHMIFVDKDAETLKYEDWARNVTTFSLESGKILSHTLDGNLNTYPEPCLSTRVGHLTFTVNRWESINGNERIAISGASIRNDRISTFYNTSGLTSSFGHNNFCVVGIKSRGEFAILRRRELLILHVRMPRTVAFLAALHRRAGAKSLLTRVATTRSSLWEPKIVRLLLAFAGAMVCD